MHYVPDSMLQLHPEFVQQYFRPTKNLLLLILIGSSTLLVHKPTPL